ncbi:nitrous oxide reductase accessory protein NosL [Halosolutus amylolyticus]|uniref:Nitrous oxide reductase accessory protein NosL n=1 Tax=Halosolutus amylolyticus TaxID=2932267 RepID=A0ABD5PKX2_9EURY|nr:nitrous oxide reductase accessory protein NosL [Halosolutus amylolyticus]
MTRRDRTHDCAHGHPGGGAGTDRYSRRRLLGGIGAVAAAGLAGCLGSADGGDESPAEPIALDEGQTCDVCGMTIADHYGPAGQLFYADGKPGDRDGPARFDSLSELLASHEERVARGWTLRDAFVTDYSRVEYALRKREGVIYISSHVAADAFADATTLHYVVDSGVEGAMGEAIVPFGDRDDAEAFVAAHDGEIRGWDDLL